MGYLLIVAASAMFGIGPSVSTILQRSGWDALSVLWTGELGGALLLFVMIRVRRLSLKLPWRQLRPLLLLGALVYFLMGLCLNLSYRFMLTGLCTILHFVYPAVVILLMRLCFKEPVSGRKVCCVAVSMCGIGMVVGTSVVELDVRVLCGAALAVASGVFYAIYVVACDQSAMAEVDEWVASFYILITGAVFTTAYMAFSGRLWVCFRGEQTLLACLIPVLQTAGLVFFAKGVHKTGASGAAIVNMLEPALSLVVSIIVFGGEITAAALAGCCLVLLSIVISAAR